MTYRTAKQQIASMKAAQQQVADDGADQIAAIMPHKAQTWKAAHQS